MKSIGEAIQFLHAMNIAHRDVKVRVSLIISSSDAPLILDAYNSLGLLSFSARKSYLFIEAFLPRS